MAKENALDSLLLSHLSVSITICSVETESQRLLNWCKIARGVQGELDTHTHFLLVLIIFLINNIYLLVLLGPSCGTQDLRSLLQHANS